MRRVLFAVFILLTVAGAARAYESGPIIANNIMGGAGAGTLIGFAAGLYGYGQSDNYNSKLILVDSVYGFLTGAVVGAGIGVLVSNQQKPDTGYTVSSYTSSGLLLGMMIGGVAAVIPYADDQKGSHFTTYMGIGGLIGAVAGFGVAIVDIQGRPSEVKFSGRVGIFPETALLPSVAPNDAAPMVVAARLAEIQF